MFVNEEIDSSSYLFTISTNTTSIPFNYKKVSNNKILYLVSGTEIELHRK